ncbi:citrate transporter [Imhoffiella purpurea]|uniref:Putative transport protein n=1 Tax=Imhoffiella purpurea TaxID=1249627 RepID=W9V9U2_9GAMM|nr:citrate transporter [Imhoffiella purpurea]EXJ16353.1 putative transport protein [Imhoffiella purpurea]
MNPLPNPSSANPDAKHSSLPWRRSIVALFMLVALAMPLLLYAAPVGNPISILGIRIEFILFALTLLGVAFFHNHTLLVALAGLSAITAYKWHIAGFEQGLGLDGLLHHLGHEWVILTNLLGLLLGFALLARHFEDSGVPDALPRFLPQGAFGAFTLLCLIFVMSAFLDNIAAALIGGTIAASVYKYKVHIGYLAAIVAASNAGGAGSVVGDTTTTMMWISGVAPYQVLHAFIAAGAALLLFGIPASIQQSRTAPIVRDTSTEVRIDWDRLWIVGGILAAAVATNVIVNWAFKDIAESFPFLGVAVWVAILAAMRVRQPEWGLLPEALKGSLFLLSLVFCASLMPVEELPEASWFSAMILGFVSAVFDNIPLTALAIQQGGFDWGVLAFAVGFGGSMVWFGSSAGVALSNMYPQAKSVGAWLRNGWHIPIGYVAGFALLMLTLGWHPEPPHHASDEASASADHPASLTAPEPQAQLAFHAPNGQESFQ